jgi:hypothetical protein
MVRSQHADQVAAPVDGLDHRVVVRAPGVAFAAPAFQLVVGRQQHRRHQQRKPGDRLQPALALLRRQDRQTRVVARRTPGALGIQLPQGLQHLRVQASAKGQRTRVGRAPAPRPQQGHHRRRVHGDRPPECRIVHLQQQAARIGERSGHQGRQNVVSPQA